MGVFEWEWVATFVLSMGVYSIAFATACVLLKWDFRSFAVWLFVGSTVLEFVGFFVMLQVRLVLWNNYVFLGIGFSLTIGSLIYLFLITKTYAKLVLQERHSAAAEDVEYQD